MYNKHLMIESYACIKPYHYQKWQLKEADRKKVIFWLYQIDHALPNHQIYKK